MQVAQKEGSRQANNKKEERSNMKPCRGINICDCSVLDSPNLVPTNTTGTPGE